MKVLLLLCSCGIATSSLPILKTVRPVALLMKGGKSSPQSLPQDSVQFMITQKMKYILVNELDYTVEEVERMEPKVARVVIDKKLKRPSQGMPRSWDVNYRGSVNMIDRISAISGKCIGITASSLKTGHLSYALCAALSLYSLKYISQQLSQKSRLTLGQSDRQHSFSAGSSKQNRLDLRYMERLQRVSFLDKIKVAIDVLKHGFF